jgi:hypothetical protein
MVRKGRAPVQAEGLPPDLVSIPARCFAIDMAGGYVKFAVQLTGRREMKNKIVLALIAAWISFPACSAGLFKCTGADGRIEYSQQPCSGPASQKTVDVPDSQEQAMRRSHNERLDKALRMKKEYEESGQKERDEKARKEELAKAYEPEVGMARAEAWKSSWGTPKKVNRTTTAYGVTEQWVYDCCGRYVYISKGVVKSIQN